MQRSLTGEVFNLLSNPRLPEQVQSCAELIRPEKPIEIDENAAREMVAPLIWMLARIGTQGLPLTKVGYLRPVDVTALMTELGWSQWWIGKANREEQTAPASRLRETVLETRLVRRLKGSLVLTPLGRTLADDPVGLWFHIANILPVEKHQGQRVAAILSILSALAATDQKDEAASTSTLITRRALAELGWTNSDGSPLKEFDLINSWRQTRDVLAILGVTAFRGNTSPAPDRATFLRAVLTQPVPTDASSLTESTLRPRRAHTLIVTLDDVVPTVWRKIVVPSTITLLQLHEVIQTSMGWTRSHLFAFQVGEDRYGYPDPDWDRMKNAGRIKLDKVLPDPGTQARYDYDFGDGWSHSITVEAITTLDDYPVLLAGANACPPEDCGGPHGYQEMLEAQADPSHERHEEFREWLGQTFDPTTFNLARVNNSLRLEANNW